MRCQLFTFLAISIFCTDVTFGQNGAKRFSANNTTKIYEAVLPLGRAVKAAAGPTSTGFVINLGKPGDGIAIKNTKAARQLAIHYSSSGVGAIAIAVNGHSRQKINIHVQYN